uniref:Cyclic nucleotide-binding domain-containing protein n=1 Tax=Monopterus albus TaxID=43700 RepID=A0A3Q3QMY2_MONAL
FGPTLGKKNYTIFSVNILMKLLHIVSKWTRVTVFLYFQDYFEKGEYIIREGEEGNTFFIIHFAVPLGGSCNPHKLYAMQIVCRCPSIYRK